MRWFETPQPLPPVGTEAEEWYHPPSYVVSRCAHWYFLKKTTSKKTKYLTHQNVAGHLNNKKSGSNQNVHQRNWSVDWKYQPDEDGVDTENYHDEDNVYIWYDIRGKNHNTKWLCSNELATLPKNMCGSVQFSRSVMSDSLWPHGLQHARRTWNVRSINQGKLEVVKQETARVNIYILGISELKWTGMGEFNSDDHYIYYCGQDSLRKNGAAIIVNERVWNAVLGCNLQNNRMISVCFQDKPFNTTVIQVYVPTTNVKEDEVEQFYEDLQDFLELTCQKMSFSL